MTLYKTSDGIGFIDVVDVLGTDCSVVNAARVSFGKKVSEIREQDKKLLNYLSAHNHTSPFRHAVVQFHVKATEFVARQWYKHLVGTDYVFKDTAWNEISGRYVEYKPESYIPVTLRGQSADNKQASSDEVIDDPSLLKEFNDQVSACFALYEKMLKAGVAREQARMILPLTFYTEWYWTASLQAVHHFVSLRREKNAQAEIREYAELLNEAMSKFFPNAWASLQAL